MTRLYLEVGSLPWRQICDACKAEEPVIPQAMKSMLALSVATELFEAKHGACRVKRKRAKK